MTARNTFDPNRIQRIPPNKFYLDNFDDKNKYVAMQRIEHEIISYYFAIMNHVKNISETLQKLLSWSAGWGGHVESDKVNLGLWKITGICVSLHVITNTLCILHIPAAQS